jgi:hypothetical protein
MTINNQNLEPVTMGQFTLEYDLEAGALNITDNQNRITITMGVDGIDFVDADSNLLTAMSYELLLGG